MRVIGCKHERLDRSFRGPTGSKPTHSRRAFVRAFRISIHMSKQLRAASPKARRRRPRAPNRGGRSSRQQSRELRQKYVHVLFIPPARAVRLPTSVRACVGVWCFGRPRVPARCSRPVGRCCSASLARRRACVSPKCCAPRISPGIATDRSAAAALTSHFAARAAKWAPSLPEGEREERVPRFSFLSLRERRGPSNATGVAWEVRAAVRMRLMLFEPTSLILRACESFSFRNFRHESNQGLTSRENAEKPIDSQTLRRAPS